MTGLAYTLIGIGVFIMIIVIDSIKNAPLYEEQKHGNWKLINKNKKDETR